MVINDQTINCPEEVKMSNENAAPTAVVRHIEDTPPLPGLACLGLGIGFLLLLAALLIGVRYLAG